MTDHLCLPYGVVDVHDEMMLDSVGDVNALIDLIVFGVTMCHSCKMQKSKKFGILHKKYHIYSIPTHVHGICYKWYKVYEFKSV